MIWTKRFLFLHLPKTAGMSLTNLLTNKSVDPVFYTCPEQEAHGASAVHVIGNRHEALLEAEAYFSRFKQSVLDFEKIFVVMRNPYDFELSRFHYLQKGHSWDAGVAQDIAMKGSFRDFLEFAPFYGRLPPRLDAYFEVLGETPPNLVVLRFERLQEDLDTHLSRFLKSTDLEHMNRSVHAPFEEEYDAETEDLCHRRHRWFFDKGFYSRIRF